MADTPDTARLADIRQGWTHEGRVINSDMGWALDHIDTLTAELAYANSGATFRHIADKLAAQADAAEARAEKAEAERDALRALLAEAGGTGDAWQQARGVVDLHGEPAESVIRRGRGE